MNTESLTQFRLESFYVNSKITSGSHIVFISNFNDEFRKELIEKLSNELIEILPDSDYLIWYNMTYTEEETFLRVLLKVAQSCMIYSSDVIPILEYDGTNHQDLVDFITQNFEQQEELKEKE